MKKITKLMLALTLLILGAGGVNATKLYATYGTPAGNGNWNAETSEYTWTGSSNNLMDLFTFSNGELADYQSLHFSTGNYVDQVYRVCFMIGSNAAATIAFYSAGEKNLVFADRDETKNLDLSTITSIKFGGASGAGSITITSRPYLLKPTKFEFNNEGKAYLYPSDLTATSWGIDSYDEETGIVVKNSEGYGGLSFDFGETGYDFSEITNIEINIETEGYDDIRVYANVTDINNHTQYISATGGAYSLGSEIDSNIKVWNLGFYNKTGSMKVNYVCFTSNIVKAAPGEEVAMNRLTSYHWNATASAFETSGYTPVYRVAESTGAAYFGVDWNGENCQNYTDVEGYKAIRIYSAVGNVPRAMFFKPDASGQQQFNFTWNEAGYYELSLSTVYSSVNNYKLISVRPQQGTSSSIAGICMIIDNPTFNFVISGSGLVTDKLVVALADATATSYDATGLTKAISLTPANPNALFVTNAGMLTNENNVVVDGTCANLVLTDGHPFKAPVDFTATAASYTTTLAEAGTRVLPFAAGIPSGVHAWTLTYTTGDETVAAEEVVTTIAANTPVLLNGNGVVSFNGSGAVTADATYTQGALIGVMAEEYVPAGSYVLQNNSDKKGLGFYRVADDNTVKITPFRAYLTAEDAIASRLNIVFAGETTGIQSVATAENGENEVYNLSGQRVAAPTRGLYIVNGKKIMVK